MHKRIMWTVVVCAFCIHPAMAQRTGAIYGFVKDASGAVVPGATVVAKNTETGISRNAITDVRDGISGMDVVFSCPDHRRNKCESGASRPEQPVSAGSLLPDQRAYRHHSS